MSTPPRYIYERRGGPLLSWAGGPPSQSRAADAKSLGSLGDYSSPPGNPMGLPRPGAPEFLSNYEAIPSSSPPIRQRGLGNTFWGSVKEGARTVVAPIVNKIGEPKSLIMEGFGNYVAVGDDTVPGTVPSAAQTAFDTYKRPVASALAAYHGVKRTGSVGWALMYAVLGYIAPVTTTAVSLAQGFSEKK